MPASPSYRYPESVLIARESQLHFSEASRICSRVRATQPEVPNSNGKNCLLVSLLLFSIHPISIQGQLLGTRPICATVRFPTATPNHVRFVSNLKTWLVRSVLTKHLWAMSKIECEVETRMELWAAESAGCVQINRVFRHVSFLPTGFCVVFLWCLYCCTLFWSLSNNRSLLNFNCFNFYSVWIPGRPLKNLSKQLFVHEFKPEQKAVHFDENIVEHGDQTHFQLVVLYPGL